MPKHTRNLRELLLGKALANHALEEEKLSRFWGVPIMASDAVSSVAYAIEEMLIVLVPVLGLSAVHYLGLISLPIILLILVLAFSYVQIIGQYPNGGGAYIVSSENLGKTSSLVAASALVIAYVMTVAVSISAATAAFLAAFPRFADYRIAIALIFLCLVTFFNLRGIRESSKVFGLPTYGFILTMAILIITGFVRMALGTLTPVEYEAASLPATDALSAVSLFLLLRSFSSGCSALTGLCQDLVGETPAFF